jgi:hypothetical protein
MGASLGNAASGSNSSVSGTTPDVTIGGTAGGPSLRGQSLGSGNAWTFVATREACGLNQSERAAQAGCDDASMP